MGVLSVLRRGGSQAATMRSAVDMESGQSSWVVYIYVHRVKIWNVLVL